MRSIEWAAGFYEGEGNCAFVDNRDKDKGCNIQMKVTQVDREPLEWFREAVGVGVIYGPKQHRERGQDYYIWCCYKGVEVVTVSAQLRPYLSTRRREQIDTVLELWEDRLLAPDPAAQRTYRLRAWETRRRRYGATGCHPDRQPTGRPVGS